jgi:hypothetical protein
MALATLSLYTLGEIQEVGNSSSNVEAGKKSHKSLCKVEEAGKSLRNSSAMQTKKGSCLTTFSRPSSSGDR